MAEAVEHSLRFLSDDDLDAIADWLKQTPPIATAQGTKAAYAYQGGGEGRAAGQALYAAACASCHRLGGEGAYDGHFPSLTHNSTVGSEQANNLIMVMLQGVHRQERRCKPGCRDSPTAWMTGNWPSWAITYCSNSAIRRSG